MKRILLVLLAVSMGAGTTSGQTSASAQAAASTQSGASVEADKSGAPASGNRSASTSTSTSSSASADSGKSSAEIADGTKIHATLERSLDVKKNKPGDRVEAVAAQDVKQDGKVVVKKGTRLVGHVTESQARTKEQAQSQLGIVFDHATAANGQDIPLGATIQALALAQSSANAADDVATPGSGMGAMPGAAHGGGGLINGVTSTAGAGASSVMSTTGSAAPVNAAGTLAAASRSTGAVGGLTSTGQLASNSNGVFGLEGLSISSAASSATQGSMIVSPTKNVHLDSGTQMLLSVTGKTQAR